MNISFKNFNPSGPEFQYLEDLATAYWYSEVLFTSIELDLFDLIEKGHQTIDALSKAASCKVEALNRMTNVLECLELIHFTEKGWVNGHAARLYLIRESDRYMGNFLLYRKYMKQGWEGIREKITDEKALKVNSLSTDDPYEKRTFYYVRAMDEIARRKAEDIEKIMHKSLWQPPILDIGGGAGAVSRRLIRGKNNSESLLFDLPEVIRAAVALYPDDNDWEGLQPFGGNFIGHEFEEGSRFGVVLLSNFLHIYAEDTARFLLEKSLKMLTDDGLVLIHDYFPDRTGKFPHKGAFYDLNMMLNTSEGSCRESSRIILWLKANGMSHIETHDLSSDSTIILASRTKSRNME